MAGPDAEAFLISTEGERKFPLAGAQSWAIGRGEGCAILLDSRSVSRLHALIQRRDAGDYYLVDLGSRNGSFVDGRRVSVPARLEDGNHLVFAEQELLFRDPVPTTAPAGPPRPSSRNLPTETMRTQSLATIVVVDIREFTSLSRAISEALLSQTIGTWFLRVGQAAEHRGSWAQQYIGDAVMAVWVHRNAASVSTDLQQVLRAVCEFHRSTGEIGRALQLPNALRIGAGISTGRVMLGGTDYTALGETVNAAFRLESATKTVGISVMLSEATFADCLALETAPFRRCEVQLKGYEVPITAWAISFDDLARVVEPAPGA